MIYRIRSPLKITSIMDHDTFWTKKKEGESSYFVFSPRKLELIKEKNNGCEVKEYRGPLMPEAR